jgi:hypothetical protein
MTKVWSGEITGEENSRNSKVFVIKIDGKVTYNVDVRFWA